MSKSKPVTPWWRPGSHPGTSEDTKANTPDVNLIPGAPHAEPCGVGGRGGRRRPGTRTLPDGYAGYRFGDRGLPGGVTNPRGVGTRHTSPGADRQGRAGPDGRASPEMKPWSHHGD
ncbi:hypothetical protein GCM10009677_14400 [Sphaerisporangium rubeum]